MYWIVLACFLFIEGWASWILYWYAFFMVKAKRDFGMHCLTLVFSRVPFYSAMRTIFMFWLVLPQTQGATTLYLEYVHPTLTKHEKDIEDFMGRTHDQAKALGLQYLQQLFGYIKRAILGQLNEEPPPPPPKAESGNFAQNLLARWRVPPLSPMAPSLASDFYSFLSSALQQQTAASASTGPGAFENLIPSNITSQAEKARYIALQKERLNTVLTALERESSGLETGLPDVDDFGGRLFKSPSQGNVSSHGGDFESVDMDEADAAAAGQGKKASGWFYGWGAQKAHTE